MKILSGLSRSLSIAGRFIPLYKEIKPAVLNLPKFINKIENNIANDRTRDAKLIDVNSYPKIKNNSPVFFQ